MARHWHISLLEVDGMSEGDVTLNALPHLLSAAEVAQRMAAALRDRRPLSVVRLGDGEALTLAQEIVLPIPEVRRRGEFLPYAGVRPPDIAARDRLAAAVRSADIIGLTTAAHPDYGPLLLEALAAHGIDPGLHTCTDAVVNYTLHAGGHLRRLLLSLPRPRVLVAGNLAQGLSVALRSAGAEVVATITPVRGCTDTDRVLGEIARHSFDIGLVPAGIAAVIICAEAAHKFGKVMLDFGHLSDEIISGSKTL